MDVTPFLELRPAPQVVFDQAATLADQPRFHVGQPDGSWRPVTWRAFAEQIRDVALWLDDLGLQPGQVGALYAPNRVEWLAAALGVQAAGGVMVPIYASCTGEQAAYVLGHSEARVLFVDTPALLGRLLAVPAAFGALTKVVLLDPGLDALAVAEAARRTGQDVPTDAAIRQRVVTYAAVQDRGAELHAAAPQRLEQLLAALDLDRPGLMLYTSGTSGPPKGVPLTHRNVGVNGRDWLQCNAALLDTGLVDLLWLPMSHIFGFGEACLGNTLGFVSYLCDPTQVFAKLPEVRPEVFMSVPSVWEKLATVARAADTPALQKQKLADLGAGRMRFCLSGGAGLKREIKEFLYEHGLLVIEGYGLTESAPTLTLNRPDAFRFDSVGKPLPSVELRLAADGEILARGPNVFAGYHKDPQATAAAFTADGWLLTGDVGRFTEDGFLQIVDRKKDILVTSGGKNVPPADIELRFQNDPHLAHVVVYGDGRPYLVAGVWLQDLAVQPWLAAQGLQGEAAEAALRQLVQARLDAVNAQLAKHETIKKFAIMDRPLLVENDLLTPTLKVKRKKVYEAFRGRFEELYA